MDLYEDINNIDTQKIQSYFGDREVPELLTWKQKKGMRNELWQTIKKRS